MKMENLLNKKVNIKKNNEFIFIGVLKQSLETEYYVVIDIDDNNKRLVIPKNDNSFIIELCKNK